MSFLDDIFGTGNPADKAKPYLDQVPGFGHDAYDDYINQGRTSGKQAGGQYDVLMNDPTGFINKLMENYKTSESYNAQKNTLTNELGNAAAAGGIAGTPTDQMNQGAGIQDLLSKDMQQFLSNALGVYNRGLTGKEGEATRGYDASGKLADILGNNAGAQAGLAFQGQQQQNANKGGLWSLLAKGLGGAASFATQPTASIFGNKLWG